MNARIEAFRAYRERFEGAGDKRRFRLPNIEGPQSFEAIAKLDIAGEKTEFVDGVVVIDGGERRYADHDYRLMVENGIVSKETELIAGVIYWKKGAGPPDARTLDAIAKLQRDTKEPEHRAECQSS
jgi:hypothetical protein